MQRFTNLMIGGLLLSLIAGPVFGEEVGVARDEIEAMKSKLEQLEKALEGKTVSASAENDDSEWYRKNGCGRGCDRRAPAFIGSQGQSQPGRRYNLRFCII
jgi:hypothetical protein